MKKIEKQLFVFLLIISFTSCWKCPDEVLIDQIHTPEYVQKYQTNYLVDTLFFVSENDEELLFKKSVEIINKTEKKNYGIVPCEKNEKNMVDIYVDKDKSEFEFITESDDSLRIKFYPEIISPLIESYGKETSDTLKSIYRMKVEISVPTYNTNMSFGGYALWLDRRQEKSLEEPYAFAEENYENAFYWSSEVFGEPRFIYSFGRDFLGFVDDRGIKWIRKK